MYLATNIVIVMIFQVSINLFLVGVFQDPIFSIIAILNASGIGIFQGIILGIAILL